MSSHHIVRENQEPALVIASYSPVHEEAMQQLLEWSPLVIVVHTALDDVLLLGIKIDVAIVPHAYAEMYKEKLLHQVPVQILTCHDNDDPMTTALYYLRARHADAVSVLAGGDAAWHTWKLFAETMDTVVFHQNTRWSFVRSGRFEKWLPAGAVVTTEPTQLDSHTFRPDGQLTIVHKSPFWVGISR